MSAKVRDVMTTRVVAVRKEATFKDIAALLTEYRVSAFPSRATRKPRPGDATLWPKPGTSRGSSQCVTG